MSLTLLLPSCLNVLFLSVFAPSAQPRQHELFQLLLYMLFYHFSFFIMGDFFELVLVLILVESVITYNFLYKLVPCRMYLSIYLSVCLVLICICWNCWFSLFILCFLSVKFTCVQCVSFGFDSLLYFFGHLLCLMSSFTSSLLIIFSCVIVSLPCHLPPLLFCIYTLCLQLIPAIICSFFHCMFFPGLSGILFLSYSSFASTNHTK